MIKHLLILLVFVAGCTTIKQPEKLVSITSRANPQFTVPSYPKLSWMPSYCLDPDDIECMTNVIEYDILSSTDLVDWSLYSRTTNTFVYLTNNYSFEVFRVGAHLKQNN